MLQYFTPAFSIYKRGIVFAMRASGLIISEGVSVL